MALDGLKNRKNAYNKKEWRNQKLNLCVKTVVHRTKSGQASVKIAGSGTRLWSKRRLVVANLP
ncbi:MAG: hypothetical protein JWM00_547 [Candidatus Saccharibacteria bacterium]|nr:hypothetical protein [Candidatus Saccharibacteria bacterium]